jgi:hypothetical protein
VPLQFEVFAGATELTSTSVVTGLTVTSVTCPTLALRVNVATAPAGNTALRYDPVAGQFVYTWKTPKQAGCLRATITTQDGSSLSALFQLK